MPDCKPLKASLRLIARDSLLSQIQVQEVMSQLPQQHYTTQFVKSLGDHDLKTSLMSSSLPQDFFTRELDQALLLDQADVAIHSAKDLPRPLPAHLEVMALTAGQDPSDCLVSHGDQTLQQLPAAARIATSSALRRQEILKLRPDLTIASVRGSIQQRLQQLDDNDFDALIVATCALLRLGLEHRIAERLPIASYPLQGQLAIVAHHKRLDLKKLFEPLDVRRQYGKVYLIGFGPGDPELMTLKANRLLHAADVIDYDDLIDHSVLERYSAEKHYVGKRKGSAALSQLEINQLMAEQAQNGQQVVRLKGGDPGVFGRAGEEVQYLQQRMIPLEVVPGVTAAFAAAASQNISLTHRELSKTLSFLTAHHADQRDIEVPAVDTIVYYMAASQLPSLAETLIQKGRHSDEPVALIENASMPQEKIQICTIGSMAQYSSCSPLIIVIGQIVTCVEPPSRLLYTGLHPEHVRSLHQIVHYPLIQIEDLEMDAQQIDWTTYQTVVCSSQEAVRCLFKAFGVELAQQRRRLQWIAIGPHTAQALQDQGCFVQPVGALAHTEDQNTLPNSETVLRVLQSHPERWGRCLYPCSDRSANQVHSWPHLDALVLYRTLKKEQVRLDLASFQEIFFTSSSTVHSFFEIYDAVPATVICRCLGKFTEQTLQTYGVDASQIVLEHPSRSASASFRSGQPLVVS